MANNSDFEFTTASVTVKTNIPFTARSINTKSTHLTHNNINSFFYLIIMTQEIEFAILTHQLPSEGSILIAQTHFDLFFQENTFIKTQCWLYNDFIRFQIKNGPNVQIYTINFCFNVLFEMINQQPANKKKWCLSTCHSIRIQLYQKYLVFKNPYQKEHLSIWRNHLATKLHQRGFHEQFYPIKELGQGFFANVYKVQRFENNTLYAVKAFNKEETYSKQKGKEALINEIKVMRSLEHPNLMKIFSVYESKNSMYMCVQLLSGGELWQKIKTKKKICNFELRKIMKSILKGLEVMHTKGYMHRDLKPQNILFRQDNSTQCVIADFGLVQNVNQTQHLFVRCGTPGFVAPEVLSSKRNKVIYSYSCDMYSVGIILYLLLFKKSPFQGQTTDQILAQNKLSKFNFQDVQYQQLSPQTLCLLKGLLQKEPSKRLTAKEALQHQFFGVQNQQILESFEPGAKSIKQLKTNGISTKKGKFLSKKISLECEYQFLNTLNTNSSKQKPCEQSIEQNKIQQEQEMNLDTQNNPTPSKKLPKIKGPSRFRAKIQNVIS